MFFFYNYNVDWFSARPFLWLKYIVSLIFKIQFSVPYDKVEDFYTKLYSISNEKQKAIIRKIMEVINDTNYYQTLLYEYRKSIVLPNGEIDWSYIVYDSTVRNIINKQIKERRILVTQLNKEICESIQSEIEEQYQEI